MNIDMSEIDKLLSSERPTSSPDELFIKKAAQDILNNCCSVISTVSLSEDMQMDAANLFAEDSLLIFTYDLFQDVDNLDPEGYIKYIPDDIDLKFLSRLINYNVDSESYFKNICVPKIWKNRLSENEIRTVCSMKFYKYILDLPSSSDLFSSNESKN